MRPSVRFEVFKRDKFTCQYCGRSAPDVLLEADHIRPVAEGGTDELTNLVTSCAECNGGKGARTLDDDSAIQKAKRQLEQLQERREQLDMMMRWAEGLRDIRSQTVERVSSYWTDLTPGWKVSESGHRKIDRWLARYTVTEICEAMDAAARHYLERDQKGQITQSSWEVAFSKIPRICGVRRRERDEPYLRDLYYTRATLRNRMYVNEGYIVGLLTDAFQAGADPEVLQSLATTCSNWTEFRTETERYIDELRAEGGADPNA